MRPACPDCRPAGGWAWCTHRGPHGPQTRTPITPRWLGWLGITIDKLEDTKMCDEKVTHVGRAECRKAMAAHDRKIREETIRAMNGQPARPSLTPTEVAQRVLAGVGVVITLAMMNFIVHALLAALASVFIAVAAAAIVVTARRHRRRARTVIPAPIETQPRTVVTAVHVQAVEPARQAAPLRHAAESENRRCLS